MTSFTCLFCQARILKQEPIKYTQKTTPNQPLRQPCTRDPAYKSEDYFLN